MVEKERLLEQFEKDIGLGKSKGKALEEEKLQLVN